ncbi:MAG: hypothetical protein ACK5QX_00785 [bacterium]
MKYQSPSKAFKMAMRHHGIQNARAGESALGRRNRGARHNPNAHARALMAMLFGPLSGGL